MDVEETPYTLLTSQIASLSKAILAQLMSKTAPTTLQAGFQLLHSLLSVLLGLLPSQVSQIVITVNCRVAITNDGDVGAAYFVPVFHWPLLYSLTCRVHTVFIHSYFSP